MKDKTKPDYTMMVLMVILACVCGVGYIWYTIAPFVVACGLVTFWTIQEHRRAYGHHSGTSASQRTIPGEGWSVQRLEARGAGAPAGTAAAGR